MRYATVAFIVTRRGCIQYMQTTQAASSKSVTIETVAILTLLISPQSLQECGIVCR